MSDVKLVRALRKRYSESDIRHKLIAEDDYLASPKKSGYRGIHLIYEYKSDKSSTFNDLKVEIQLRSRLQHAWATAVETVGLFSSQYLKSSQGDKRWLRFFALMGSVIASRENSPAVPDTPSDTRSLIAELKDVSRDLDATARLKAYGQALTLVEPQSGAYFLLKLDAQTEDLTVVGYDRRHFASAQSDYLALEREQFGNPRIDTVLVSVDSVKSLRNAYPNYYLDTRAFVQVLERAVAGK